MKITFDKISSHAKKTFICACGRRVTRSKTFYQTLNPFNTIDGRPKTAIEIQREVSAQAIEWQTRVDKCTHEGMVL